MLEVFIAPVVASAVLVTITVAWAELVAERGWRRDARVAVAGVAVGQAAAEIEELRQAA